MDNKTGRKVNAAKEKIGKLMLPARSASRDLKDRLEVTIEYFAPDERKSGGAYVTVTSVVRHISVPDKVLVMEDGTVIGLENIAAISGLQFVF